MATLIPAIGSSALDSTGERRLAERLEQKFDADYLLWHNVPIGPKQSHPDCVVHYGSNTRQAHHPASLVAADLLTADHKYDDAGSGGCVPPLKPVSCGYEAKAPMTIKRHTQRDETFAISDHLSSAHEEGFAWGDMAVLCADWKTVDLCAAALAQRKLPHRVRKKSGEYRPGEEAIQVMTMKISKGLGVAGGGAAWGGAYACGGGG